HVEFPVDPLQFVSGGMDVEYRRRTVEGILESYHSNCDVLAEAIQNAVDAVEDAKLGELKAPYLIEVTVNLADNWIGVLDTGVGMSPQEVTSAFAPHVSFKQRSPAKSKRDKKNMYRGYKGVGLTFLAYGTDDIVIHSKQGGVLTKARMRYGRVWATGERSDPALMVEETGSSPLDPHSRGTYIQIQFSQTTRPRSLSKLAPTMSLWRTILRTKTAVGQVLMGRKSLAPLRVKLTLIDGQDTKTAEVEPEFLYPHQIKRSPSFRFLDLVEYHKTYPEQANPPAEKLRQDGLYLEWDAERIQKELTEKQQLAHSEQIKKYCPFVYAFVPYQGSVWSDLNQIVTGASNRTYLDSGLML
ncbi:MAG: ATP-binding protein, partial [Gaiellaceae bacterium]